jgi:hypothetical protein
MTAIKKNTVANAVNYLTKRKVFVDDSTVVSWDCPVIYGVLTHDEIKRWARAVSETDDDGLFDLLCPSGLCDSVSEWVDANGRDIGSVDMTQVYARFSQLHDRTLARGICINSKLYPRIRDREWFAPLGPQTVGLGTVDGGDCLVVLITHDWD